ncbi:MAG: transposase [Lachnospiraceae bacterium]|nr:transposase [Lachnospiraceae bacterium]
MFYKMNKSANFTPGYILVLHTFGRSLQWNPHIHYLLSEGGIGDNGFWRNVHHFNYTYMRQAFRIALLNLMEERITDPLKKAQFKKDKALSYKNQKDGFYIYAKPNLADSKTVAKYIGRYLGRPVIALSRIDGYDKENDTVTFHYNRHEDDVLVTETLNAIDFIIINPSKHQFLKSFNRWRTSILTAFGYDTLNSRLRLKGAISIK